jgi:hypothetical protein|tara:strand:- start:32 stop:238 length:207 start_codon:yes stop_codon:yes gene_type:complete
MTDSKDFPQLLYEIRQGDAVLPNAELLWFAQQIFAAKDTGMLKLDSPADETLANVLARGRAAISSATP